MAVHSDIQYFLGSNSPKGFYSLYAQLIDPEQARRIYILKGGPGCGKSTLMRRVAALTQEAGEKPELILCSGDPDSLDAVVLPHLNAALVDGTAPHVVEPRYPGLVERYVNMGDCYDTAGLGDVRTEIMTCMAGYKECYQSAYRCLDAVAQLQEDIQAILTTSHLEEKLARKAKGILSRELPRQKAARPGRVKQRFLGAVTHKGSICLYSTAQVQCSRIYELSDPCGLAHLMLSHLLAGAVEGGFDVVACPDPMAPDRLAHLLIPGLDLAFLSTGPALTFRGERYRRVRLESAVDKDLLRRSRARLRFTRRLSAALTAEAVEALSQAKAKHDALEALYHPYVDFQRVDDLASTIAGELFGI